MAKKDKVEGAEAATAGADDRFKMVADPDNQGQQVKRIDFIRRRWAEGKKRGDIARELSQITGVKVPYQIVFAATKGQAGGPAKEASGETAQA